MLPRATEWPFPCYTKFPPREIALLAPTQLNPGASEDLLSTRTVGKVYTTGVSPAARDGPGDRRLQSL